MGMVHAAQKGEKPASKEVEKLAKEMDPEDVEKFAKTKHKGLPEEKKDESNYLTFEGWLKERDPEVLEGATTTGDVAVFMRRAIPRLVKRNKKKLPCIVSDDDSDDGDDGEE